MNTRHGTDSKASFISGGRRGSGRQKHQFSKSRIKHRLPRFLGEILSRHEVASENSDLTLVTTLESVDDRTSQHDRASHPPGFESQSTIVCEDQLSALMMSTDFDDEEIVKQIGVGAPRNKVLSSTADTSLLVNVSTLAEEMKKFDDSRL